MLAAVGQGVPGVRAGDQHQAAGGLDDLGDLGGVFRGGTGQVGGGDLDQAPVGQNAQILEHPGQGPGGTGLAGPGAAGEHQVLPRGPVDRDAGVAAGLLGPQYGEQVRDLPGDRLQPGQRGQAAKSTPGGQVPSRVVIVASKPSRPVRPAVPIGDGCAGANLPPATSASPPDCRIRVPP